MGWILYILGGISVVFLATGKAIDTKNSIQIELDEFNTLLKCQACGKFHRKYQEELEMRINMHYKEYHTCPRCGGHSPIYTGEYYPWLDSNPEFPKLTWKDLKKVKKALRKTDLLSYENRMIEKFLYYHHLLPIQEKDEEKERLPDK